MRIELQDGHPVIRELRIESGASTSRPITSELLREMPLAQFARRAISAASYPRAKRQATEPATAAELRDEVSSYYLRPDPRWTVTADPAWRQFWSERQDAVHAYWQSHARPKRNRVSDALLERVAQVYRQAIATRRPPKKAVQSTFNVSEPTAGRYIARARARGFLGRTRPGKKGELDE
jgi:hypothetical protein